MADREGFYRELLNNLSDGVYFTDKDRRITYWNKGAERLTGYSAEDVLGKKCSDNLLVHVDVTGRQLCLSDCPLSRSMQGRETCESEVFLHHKDGHRLPVFVRSSHIENEAGEVIGAVEVFSNNSAKVQIESRLAEIQQLALIDSLTGLPNRRQLESQILSRLEELRRNQWAFGLLFIDIDNFKRVNDTFGHNIGDKVLRMIGRTLDENSRYFDMIGRWGGEEFVAVIANTHLVVLRDVADRMRLLVEGSGLKGPEVRVTISIGAAEAQSDDTLESLVLRADKKLYEAKQAGRNRVSI